MARSREIEPNPLKYDCVLCSRFYLDRINEFAQHIQHSLLCQELPIYVRAVIKQGTEQLSLIRVVIGHLYSH